MTSENMKEMPVQIRMRNGELIQSASVGEFNEKLDKISKDKISKDEIEKISFTSPKTGSDYRCVQGMINGVPMWQNMPMSKWLECLNWHHDKGLDPDKDDIAWISYCRYCDKNYPYKTFEELKTFINYLI
jgi:hypothetical protein